VEEYARWGGSGVHKRTGDWISNMFFCRKANTSTNSLGFVIGHRERRRHVGEEKSRRRIGLELELKHLARERKKVG